MTPYYEQDGITIYHGDCREILPTFPDRSFDLVLTDPPYGIGRDGQRVSTGGHGGRKGYEFRGWDSSIPPPEVFDEMRRVSTEQIIWGGQYFAHLLPPAPAWLVWDKGQRINQSDGELAYKSNGGALRIFTLNRVALMTDGAVHPTQKPLDLIKWCIGMGETASILDPFMGSGTTLVAAKQLGRKAVGIEIEEKYCEMAVKRLAQMELFS